MNQVLIIGGVFILIAFIIIIVLIMKTRSSLNELEEKVDKNTGRGADQRSIKGDLDTVWAKMEEVLTWIYAADPVLYA